MLTDVIVFRGTDSANQTQLWGYELASGVTFAITDVVPQTVNTSPSPITNVGEGFVFRGIYEGTNNILIYSDGTANGTRPLLTDSRGTPINVPEGFVEFGNEALFVAGSPALSSGRALFITNGDGPPIRLTDFSIKNNVGGSELFVVSGDKAYFTLHSSIANQASPGRLYVTDGTVGGTQLLADQWVSVAVPFKDGILYYGGVGNQNVLYYTDGTLAGTRSFDLAPDGGGASRHNFLGGENIAYFTSYVDNPAAPNNHRDWFAFDGSGAPRLVENPYGGLLNLGAANSSWRTAIVNDDRLFFTASDGSPGGPELFVHDGQKTTKLSGIDVANATGDLAFSNVQLANVGNKVFFTVRSSGRDELYVSDGTVGGTGKVAEIGGNIRNFIPDETGGVLYFTLGDSLWVSDGTAAGTSLVSDVSPGRGTAIPTFVTMVKLDSSVIPVDEPEPEPVELDGTSGDDVFRPGEGDHIIDGGSGGRDTVVYQGERVEFSLTIQLSGTIVLDKPGGTDTLISIDRIEFDDGTLAFDMDSANLGFTYRIYAAGYGRTPDEGGLRFWADVMDWLEDNDGGRNRQDFLAREFLTAPEFFELYGQNPSNETYIEAMYLNVLERLPDQSGYEFWVDSMERGLDRADILVYFAESPENVARTAPDLTDGVWVL